MCFALLKLSFFFCINSYTFPNSSDKCWCFVTFCYLLMFCGKLTGSSYKSNAQSKGQNFSVLLEHEHISEHTHLSVVVMTFSHLGGG